MARSAHIQPMRRFSRFVCIDWSGAVGEHPPGLALAMIGQEGAPELIAPKKRWSRQAVLEWLHSLADAREDILIGLDLSLGFPLSIAAVSFRNGMAAPIAPGRYGHASTDCAPMTRIWPLPAFCAIPRRAAIFAMQKAIQAICSKAASAACAKSSATNA